MEEDLKEYWEIKNVGTYNLETGFRVYKTPEDADPYLHAHTTYEFTFSDHGFTEPAEPEKPADEKEMGAAALLSVAATALAAFLLF